MMKEKGEALVLAGGWQQLQIEEKGKRKRRSMGEKVLRMMKYVEDGMSRGKKKKKVSASNY